MLAVSGVVKSYGGDEVLSGVWFALSPGERAALVGPNGCGKSTLLRIVAGLQEADAGSIVFQPDCRAGYLGQEGQLSPDRTLYEEMASVFADVFAMERQLREFEEAMARVEGEALTQCMRDYSALQSRYDHAEAHTLDARIRTVLAGLGFRPGDAERPCREFSGGWQMRGALAQLLLRSPDLLLLDEPTNHLDLWAVEWLEQYLCGYAGTVLLVSHDRAFLDRATQRTLELRCGQLHDYAGNYSFFLEEREARKERQLQAHEAQERKIAQTERFIERFRAKATLASRVKSREKMLDKLERVETPDSGPAMIRGSFAAGLRSGQEVLSVKQLAMAYGQLLVFEGVSLDLERGGRLAVVGRNGCGKSTLLRILAGLEEPARGTVRRGLRVTPSYFAQHQAEALDPERTALEAVEEIAPPGTSVTRIRTVLGCLLFRGEEVFKKIGVLSGGERSRVALARCILRPSNLLLLDEPTNHLDIGARDWLLEALAEYPGAILLVTHDRHFINGLAERVLELSDGSGRLFDGNYDDYRAITQREEEQARRLAAAARAGSKQRKLPPARSLKPSTPTKVQWKLEALEAKIFELEGEIARLAEALADPRLYEDSERAAATRAEYEQLTARCQELTGLWDEMTA
ncbi:MAG: ABC-F family ATP-binding cassette domain-containing protein [Armatimonadetes bacterium]|nr:ABC-F family ATP-binding cassette domain-containing protein [Armatimonadota bacterium]